MGQFNLCYSPRFDQAIIEQDLSALLVLGALADRSLEQWAARLAERYRIYATYYPHAMWAPGLALTLEMHSMTELYLPMDEIRRAFDRLLSIAVRFAADTRASTVHNAADWLDELRLLRPPPLSPDPAALLLQLMADEELRRSFIFANFMSARHGGGFGRYPGQSAFLREWLKGNRSRLSGPVHCLDAACGGGEGTYELALLLIECGFKGASMRIDGATLEPFELFAAAHCYFPHDPRRTAECRRVAGTLRERGAADNIRFTLEDLTVAGHGGEYDIILCNGFLGGPFLHDSQVLRETMLILAGRLRPGGVLMAADRFHGGWKKLADEGMLRRILAECGLRILPVAEGVAGTRD